MLKSKIFLVAAAFFGIALLTLAGFAFYALSTRYYLTSSGDNTYRIDRWTGETSVISKSGTVINLGEETVEQAQERLKEAKEQNRPKGFPIIYLSLVNFEFADNNSYSPSGQFRIANHSTDLTAIDITMRLKAFESQKTQEVLDTFDIKLSGELPPGVTKEFSGVIPSNDSRYYTAEIISAISAGN